MTRSLLFFIILLPLFSLTGCEGEKKKTNLEQRRSDDQFFTENATASLEDFKNESGSFSTDYLRLFKDDPIAWQPWDDTIKKKATDTQRPILMCVVSATTTSCRETIKSIYSDPKLLNLLRDQNLCTLVDIHAHPEIGFLTNQLCSDSGQNVSFPTLIWLSHEAMPIASFPLGQMGPKKIEAAIKNAAAMVDHIWNQSSNYAISNSRANHQSRQKATDDYLLGKFIIKQDDEDTSIKIPKKRSEIFRSSTRQIISYYDPITRTIDGLGGLMPSSALCIISKANLSPRFNPQTRKRATIAFQESASNITTSAARDMVEGGYFQAKRSKDWSLPVFSKTANTQAELALSLIQGGQATQNHALTKEGLSILDHLSTHWIPETISIESPTSEELEPGKYLWNWEEFEKALTPDELIFLSKVFRIRKLGNIPATADPTGQFFKLNNLQLNRSWDAISDSVNLPIHEIQRKLNPSFAKLKEARGNHNTTFQEKNLSAEQVAILGLAFQAGWNATGNETYLLQALQLAARLNSEYRGTDQTFLRMTAPQPIHARGIDYAQAILLFEQLYETTLHEKWLTLALELTQEALTALSREGFPLQESRNDDHIIPLHIHNSRMIFGASSGGLFDQVFTRLYAITGDQAYAARRTPLTEIFPVYISMSPIIFTDYLASFALGDEPLLITLEGDSTSPLFKETLRGLRNPQFSSFASLVSANSNNRRNSPAIQSSGENLKITLSRGQEILGEATDLASFQDLFLSELRKKE
ncbi:DUF255 domain-containing protein [Akkermansiaceae bacterium]|nr:DUF255 domain-containing protein [Akkermansiaceae bacterium]